jgi:hypothetical protein
MTPRTTPGRSPRRRCTGWAAEFGAFGNVSDPDNRIVQEAKQHKQREEDNPGDPPSE